MKFRTKKMTAILTAAVLSVSLTGGVQVKAQESTETEEGFSIDQFQGTFKPSDVTLPVQDSYEYPYLGLNFTLPKKLKNCMEEKSVAVITNENWDEKGESWKYAYFGIYEMTEEQRDAEVEKIGDGYDKWMAGLKRIGVLGVYDKDSEKNLDEITGCTEHKELGSGKNGSYKYYLSLNKEADQDLSKMVEEIKTTITDMADFQQISVFETVKQAETSDAASVGTFETTGIDGETYTEKIFSDHDLTMVNIFTTWCSPCVKEIPELDKLYKEMKDNGIGVVGVVLDTLGEKGKQDEEAVKKAEVLQKKTEASYPFLIPYEGMMNGRLEGISAFPETFFVDKNGNIVGETYTGSHTLGEWEDIVVKELEKISK